MLLESSIMLLENNYSTGITYNNRHLWSSYYYSTGPDDWNPTDWLLTDPIPMTES